MVCNNTRLLRSDGGIAGPWALVTPVAPSFPPGPDVTGWEDAFLWVDSKVCMYLRGRADCSRSYYFRWMHGTGAQIQWREGGRRVRW